MASLKEILASRPDYREKTVQIAALSGAEITIRRMTIGERKEMVSRFKIGEEDADTIGAGVFAVSKCIVPEVPEEEISSMPATIIDEISGAISDFNGWTKKGAAEIADQFRPAT